MGRGAAAVAQRRGVDPKLKNASGALSRGDAAKDREKEARRRAGAARRAGDQDALRKAKNDRNQHAKDRKDAYRQAINKAKSALRDILIQKQKASDKRADLRRRIRKAPPNSKLRNSLRSAIVRQNNALLRLRRQEKRARDILKKAQQRNT